MGKIGFLSTLLLDVMRIGLGVYSLHIKSMHNNVPDYKATCDISDMVSCTKTLTSSYGSGFGLIGPLLGENHPLNVSNGYYALVFFALHVLLVCFSSGKGGALIRLITSIMMGIGCAWMAYILFFVLKHICLVCIPMYVLNALTIIVDCVYLTRVNRASAAAAQKKRK